MDIEQLKLILATVSTLGVETKDFAMWWLAYEVLCTLVKYGSLLGAIGIVAYTVMRIIGATSGIDKMDRFMKDMRKVLGTGTGGHMTEAEFDDTTELLRLLAQKHREGQRK